jgi:hypothetical protein
LAAKVLLALACTSLLLARLTTAQNGTPTAAVPPPVPEPEPAELLRKATYDISFADSHLTQAGGKFLLNQLAHAQFVLLGEPHFDHDTPLFADALYHDLHAKYGFHHLVVEQDAVGMQDALQPESRGDVAKIAAIARLDPYLTGFASDQDLQFLADVARLEKGPDPVWGIEQAQGTTRYFRELAQLAPNATVRSECESLLTAARAIEMCQRRCSSSAMNICTMA